MPLVSRRVSYTALAVGDDEESTTPPVSPLLAPPNHGLQQQQQQRVVSSPQLKYETWGPQAPSRTPRAAVGAAAKSARRRWLLLGIPLGGSILLLLYTFLLRPSYNAGKVTLRSPNHIYLFATPFPAERPYEVHPIHELMAEGERLWQEKQGRQSETYEEAVKEYERRYGRSPPRGFETW